MTIQLFFIVPDSEIYLSTITDLETIRQVLQTALLNACVKTLQKTFICLYLH